MIHAYYGEGKGKTCAAMGLALRALGHDRSIWIVQFLKGRLSGEAAMLTRMSGVTLLLGKADLPFVWEMTDAQKESTRVRHNQQLACACDAVRQGRCDMLILDECFGAIETGLLDEKALIHFLDEQPKAEIVLTGRVLPESVRERADYITLMQGERHPFDKGVAAREGIEY